MADTSQQQQEAPEPPQTNGAIDGLTEEEKSKMRPADIDADMREMERRKRVEMMMNSRLFREELERIIETQMKDGSGPSGLLQQISEMMGPQGARFNANVFRNSNCVVPINDIRGVESMGYAKGEKLLRCKLAAVFRLLDLYGWTQGVGGMITARLNQDQEHFLVNPYGLLYHETTASSLVKADMQGGIVEQGTTNFGVHIASYQLHSTIHAARPDIKCIVHIATPSVTAISATKSGILPLGQESIVIGEVSTHHYISGANLDPEEREKLARNFGPINKVMLLTNRGALCCGETVEEAFYNVYNTVLACETQLKLMPLGVDNLNLISDEARKAIYEVSRKAPIPQHSSVAEPSPLAEKLEKRWRIGGTEFEALMRMLDNAGFRTGYIYRHPLVKSEPPRPRNDVEVPPAVSSLGYLLEEEELYKQGLWKGGRKGTDRTRWLNSPNVYQKVEILETGTPDPKKITKWVSDGSPTHSSTPVKIDGALQFVPKNTNPKEFKQLQQQIKDYRRADKISAGPQSHILEGVTWEEAKKMQDATISGTGEQVVLVGAASKGIIQRGFQHNAMVYKTPYAKNPFDAVTDQELDQYKKEIERKTKGDPYDESQSESEALSSFNISRATHESSTAKSPIQSPVSVTSETEEESRDEPKVLRIETKQVPAPSQPEVVLSDERSVKISVAGNSVARREDVKPEHSKAQRATNIRTVNADFLNEQRRSEMLTRRNTNGRGVSGVSRLSSSRSISSNSINEHNCSWSENYQPCYIERTRVEKLAEPMKAFITDVQNVAKIKRKMKKREFFENYEKRFKNNAFMHVKNESESNTIESMSDADICEDSNKLCKVRRQLQGKMNEKELVHDVQYTKTTDISFAEKIHLPVECKIMERNIYNVNYEQNQNLLHSPAGVQTSMSNNNQFTNAKIHDNHEKPNTRSTTLSQNIIDNRSSFEPENIICNSHYKDGDDVTNYVNELEIFVNNDSQNTVQSTEAIHSFRSEEHCTNESPEVAFYPTIELQMKNNATEEHQFNFISSKENSLDSTLKASSNETDRHENKQELDEYDENECLCVMDSDMCENINRYVNELDVSVYHYSDDSSNEERKEDSKQKLVIIEKQDCENNNCPINNAIDSKFIQVEIINNLDDKGRLEETNYINEVEFLVCDNSNFLGRDMTVDSITEDPLKLSLKNKTINGVDNTRQETGIWNMEKVDLASDEDTSKKIKFNENKECEINQMFEKDSLVCNHSTPLDEDDIEKNPLDVSLKIFLASEKDSVSEKSLDNITVKEEDMSNLSIDSCKKKSDENGNLWLSMINDSSNFAEDTLDQSREIFKSVPNCLDFTYSEIEKYSEDNSPASTTHCSFFGDDDLLVNRIARRDSLVEVVSSINVDMKPSKKLTVDTLADTENSVKYNLDSQNMSLIYSITPPNDIGDSSKDTTITEDILEDNEEEYETFDNDIDNEDMNLMNLSNYTDKKELVNMNKTTELSEASFLSNFSNQGSDLLELPTHTYLDLQKSSDEIFHKNMSSSVNQILTELNDAEVFVTAENFVNQIVDYISCLDLRYNTTVCSKEQLNNFIRKKVSSLNFARKLAKDLVGNLPCYDANNSTNSKVSNTDESSRLESLDQTVYVIREIIHHIVDKDSLGKCDFKSKKTVTDKKVKESMNIELKGLKDEYDVEDEQSLKCSTPKMLLSPRRSRNSSFSEEQILTNLENDTGNHEINEDNVTSSSKSQQSSDTAVSSHSSPSTESQNFAEQEVTSESTDNDTKSDNSKEKPTDSGNIQKNQFISANLHSNPIINTNYQVFSEDQECENLSNKISFCVIECSKEEHLNLGPDLHNDIHVDKKDSDTASDESIRDFMERFMNCQEEIDQMWQTSEDRLEKIYASERLGEISNLKKGIMVCQENIRELHQKIEIEAASIFSGIEEASTSFICIENDPDNTEETHVRFEQVDKNCTCCHLADETVVLENTTTQILSPISEEPELESLEAAESQAVDSFETLPPIFDEPEFYSSYDDILDGDSESRTMEFYSCQNSTSMKSFGDPEFTDSTFTISAEEISNPEKAYGADISTNNDTVSASSTILYPSETGISDVNSISLQANITENLADISSDSSQAGNNEEVVLEYMTHSYDTKEFIKLERACSSDDSNCADTMHFNSLLSNHVV